MVGDLVVAVVADAAPEQDVLCRADAGGDGVPDRRPQRESSPGGVYGTLLSGHGLASARFPVRVRLTHSRPHVGEQSYRAEYWHFRLRGGMGRCCANLAVRPPPAEPSREKIGCTHPRSASWWTVAAATSGCLRNETHGQRAELRSATSDSSTGFVTMEFNDGSMSGQLGDDRSERISGVGADNEVGEAAVLPPPQDLLGGRRWVVREYRERVRRA
jgi:hypothetical protein